MKKVILIFFIFFMIVVTGLTKNSSKELENQIFIIKENIEVLKNKYELVLLDFNFLTSPAQLFQYQSQYFENDLVSIDITKLKEIKKENDSLIIKDLNKIEKHNE